MSGSRRALGGRVRAPTSSVDVRIAILALAVIAADLTAKMWAWSVTAHGDTDRIVRSSNPGLALGVATPPWAVTMVLVAGLALVIGWIARRAVRAGQLEPWVAAMLIGGATANLLDRLVSGGVHDFLRIGNVALNLADAAFIIGFFGVAAATVRQRAARRAAPLPVRGA